ncbi:MAG: N-acetylneuraminate synthase family protein [Planctomycetes bacterium]|nr:N-acetylneuraminate synthase family protein [Planctomycetota bacterium]
MGQVAHANGIRGVMKFQFRELDTFIHPAHRKGSKNKHVPRFLSTRLTKADYVKMTAAVKEAGLIAMSTPFDEASVDLILELGIEIIKVASCSATDWPLLEKIAEASRPVVFSTGGLTLKQIDDIVSFLDHRRVSSAIEHCVSIYPTPDAQAQLNMIEILRRRYPDRTIGYSTHEDPDDTAPVMVAIAKGARILERHVGIETADIKLNAYSSTPAQADKWIKAALKAKTLCGPLERLPAPAEEIASLNSLKRGVFAKHNVKEGVALTKEDVYFAMPPEDGQLSSGEFREGTTATADIKKDAALTPENVATPHDKDRQVLFTAIHTMKGMLNEARVALPTDFRAEFSHHYGIAKFAQVGATIIDCINRSYCKKLVIQIPGQHHPSHHHRKKEESFQVLYGVLEMEVDGRRRTLYPGDILLVQQGVWHEFWSDTGVIFEEVSTTHFNDDSFYEDKTINSMARSARKTVVNHWGQFQL